MQCHIYLELITLQLCQIGLQLGNIPAWQMSPARQITCSKKEKQFSSLISIQCLSEKIQFFPNTSKVPFYNELRIPILQ